MREALIVWGGWSGHEPEQCADIIAGMLRESGFKVYLETSTEAFADPALKDLSLIVPIMTMSKIEKEELANLSAAVRGGVGLAGQHGGMADAFREVTGIPIYLRRPVGRPSRQRHRLPGGYHTAGRSGDAGPVQLRVSLGTILYARGSVERSAGDHYILRRNMHPGSTAW